MIFFSAPHSPHPPRFSPPEPLGPLPAKFSKSRAIWETAKKKVTGLNPRTLLQEQPFERGGRPGDGALRILHAGHADDKAVRTKFFFFLQRMRTRHVLILAG